MSRFLCHLSLAYVVVTTPKSPWLIIIKAYLSLMVHFGYGLAVYGSTCLHPGFHTANRDMLLPGIEKSTELDTAMALTVSARK